MSAASEALADVRGWLCDNLNAGDAGKVCGMLSVVSRHITELEFKNAELLQDRDLFRELFDLTTQPDRYVQVRDENAKLRELLADTLIDPRDYCAKYGIDYDGWDSANDDIDRRLRELGIEVRHV